MSQPDATLDAAPEHGTPPPLPARDVRPLYWSVRRELWENRSIVLVPLIAAGVILFGFLLGVRHLPQAMQALGELALEKRNAAFSMPYGVSVGVVFVASALVGVFYSLDALYGERRDRSILFWKSLPVSDTTAVLSKAAIPLLVLPLLTFAVIVVLQLAMLLTGSAVLAAHGMSALPLWTSIPVQNMWLAVFFSVIAMALWHAPLYGWLFLVSAWARRNAFLWAVLPPLGVTVVEKIAFGTSYFSDLIGERLGGWLPAGFHKGHGDPAIALNGNPDSPNIALPHLAVIDFLTSPGLWLGLAAAAALFYAAIRLRRQREPI